MFYFNVNLYSNKWMGKNKGNIWMVNVGSLLLHKNKNHRHTPFTTNCVKYVEQICSWINIYNSTTLLEPQSKLRETDLHCIYNYRHTYIDEMNSQHSTVVHCYENMWLFFRVIHHPNKTNGKMPQINLFNIIH